jgi:hypothetical protein
MLEQHLEMPLFDKRIAEGAYPKNLAAFVDCCMWHMWKRHAVYALHGDLYLSRLRTAKPSMDQKAYRDHVAGASMHRANGLMHMVRCAKADGLEQLEIPCWDGPRPLLSIADQAVSDMRKACTLRSEKYGMPGCTEGTVKAYQAALRNLAEALEVYNEVSKTPDGKTGEVVAKLRARATDLFLNDPKKLAACVAGTTFAPSEQASLARDVRLGDGAVDRVRVMVRRQEEKVASQASCARCRTAVATHHGYSCRCLCMCAGCVAAGERTSTSGRILECPNCQEFTEFVRA